MRKPNPSQGNHTSVAASNQRHAGAVGELLPPPGPRSAVRSRRPQSPHLSLRGLHAVDRPPRVGQCFAAAMALAIGAREGPNSIEAAARKCSATEKPRIHGLFLVPLPGFEPGFPP